MRKKEQAEKEEEGDEEEAKSQAVPVWVSAQLLFMTSSTFSLLTAARDISTSLLVLVVQSLIVAWFDSGYSSCVSC